MHSRLPKGPPHRWLVRAGSVLALLLPHIPIAHAAQGIYLSWNECAQSTLARSDFSGPCSSSAGEQTLYCAFTLPQAIDSVVAVEAVLDVQHSAPQMPDWWQFSSGGCHEGGLIGSADFTGHNACADFWQGQATLDALSGYFVRQPRGGANQARILLAFALLPKYSRSLNGTDMYYAMRVIFRNDTTTSCAGCAEPACLVLNSILIGRLPGAAGGDLVLDSSPGQANRVTWHGTGANCDAVPARSRTWGQLKSLYRGR